MVYNATTWQTGDLITAALLNNTESQYTAYQQAYGPFKFTNGATTDTIVWEDPSTINVYLSATNESLWSTDRAIGAGNYTLKINIPTCIQPSCVRIQLTGKTCVSTNTISLSIRRIDTTGGFENATAVFTFTSSNFNTTYRNFQVYPGEELLLQGQIGVGNTYCAFKNIGLYGVSVTPSTGIAYST